MTEKPLLQALRGDRPGRTPIWLMRQAGRYLPEYRKIRAEVDGFLDLCLDPARAIEVTLQPIRRFGMDGAILFSDILIVPHALGQEVAFREGEGPVLDPVRDGAAVARLDAGGLHGRLAPVYETVEGLADELRRLDERVALIGFCGAPWTVATYMVEGGTSKDFMAVKRWAYGDAEGFGALIDVLVEASAAYLVRQAGAGAEVLQIFESWAGAVDSAGFRRWVIGPVREIVQRVRRACPDVPIIGFPRGAGHFVAEFVRETGVDAVSLDSLVEPEWAAETLAGSVAVQGNLDPAYLLVGGGAMTAAADRILDSLAGGRFVFNLGHGVTPGTPVEHVGALVDHVHGRRRA